MNDSTSQMPQMAKSESVKVAVRCRPMTKKEISDGHQRIVEMDTDQGVVELRTVRPSTSSLQASMNGSLGPASGKGENETIKQFTFDAVFDCNSKQSDLYEEMVRPLVDCILEGFNGTIFAYGQTGTGKTYTMEGVREDEQRKGIIPNSFSQIFQHIARTPTKQYLVRASYLEIYQEEVKDLLAKDQTKRLELKERADVGVYVKDLSSFVCKSIKEIEHVMTIGNQNRSVGATNMNEHSSRSHAIFIITIEHSKVRENEEGSFKHQAKANPKRDLERLKLENKENEQEETTVESLELSHAGEQMADKEEETENIEKRNVPMTGHIRVGKLNLVDLAGSERQIKTGTAGKRQKEAIKINLSLSALGNVISALVDGKSTHIPYRDSKLTRLLQDSLGGNSKTVMIANIGPASYNYEETLITLRYANRAKNIKNKPRLNEDPKDALLKQFQLEIERLKYLLSQRKKGLTSGNASLCASAYETSSLNRSPLMSASSTGDAFTLEPEKLASRIRQMESKLLCGGRNIVDHTNEQQRQLQRKEQLIAEQKRREREMRQRLTEQEENTLEVRETYSSLQQEVELKRRKLRKLFAKLQSVRAEVRDSQDANANERRELEELQNELMKELKLKYLIIENFMPPVEKNRILSRISYDDETEEWRLRPNSAGEKKKMLQLIEQERFENEFDEMKLMTGLSQQMITPDCINLNLALLPLSLLYRPRFNLILHLIQSEENTKLYEEPLSQNSIEAALDSALNVEPEIVVNAGPSSDLKWTSNTSVHPLNALDQLEDYSNKRLSSSHSSQRLNSQNDFKPNRLENEIQFPKARGLIKR